MEVHEAGGGIHFTVDRVREASEDKLYEEFKGYLQRMLETGWLVKIFIMANDYVGK